MNTEQTTDTAVTQPQLIGHNIYIKSSTFEAALLTPEILKIAGQSEVEFEVRTNFQERGNDQYEAALSLNFTAKHEGSFLWRVQLVQAGLYAFKNFSEEQRKQVLYGYCMNQLYPYACMNVTHLVVQGGFPAPQSMPMDFNQLYQEQQKHQSAASMQ